MDIFNLLTMIGGLALFLYGMNVMGDGLTKVSGGRLEKILEKLTSNPLKAVLLGAGVTAVIQSSSATTVMIVGFVNSGVMKLSQTVGIIMGANIGTTVTSWILSLSGIESSNVWVRLLKPSSFSPILAVIGIILLMFSKKEKKKNIGTTMIGFAVLMFGMETMSSAVKPLAEVPEFTNVLTMFSNPILGLLAGMILTAIIQSSSASVGILQALCITESVSFGTAFPIIMGQNIGTCITALLSAIGANKNAKRAALIHLYFNLIGTIVVMVAFYALNAVFNFSFLQNSASAAGIAVIHSIFNVVATLLLLPFSKWLERLAIMTIKDNTEEKREENALLSQAEKDFNLLDSRFLEKPGFATEQCRIVATNMANLAQESLFISIELLDHYDQDKAKQVSDLEEEIDHYENQLGTYLVRLSQKQISEKDSHSLSIILHCLSDFERISDHAVSIMYSAKEMKEKELSFSKKAVDELAIYTQAVREIVSIATDAFQKEDASNVVLVETLEEVIDYLKAELKQRHVKRLQKGKCTIEMGFILSDIIASYERISDHCSNIAVCLMEVKENKYNVHEFADDTEQTNNELFKHNYELYKEKYLLP